MAKFKPVVYGDLMISRHLGRGIVIDTAPQHTKIAPAALSNARWPYIDFPTPDTIKIADQVVYRITGWDADACALTAELVDDLRPGAEPAAERATPHTPPAHPTGDR